MFYRLKLFGLFFILTFLLSNLFAQTYLGKPLGPDVSTLNGQQLKWETGSHDFFVMFKSMLADNVRTICDSQGKPMGCDAQGNPQADACLDHSTYELTQGKVPLDAYVEKAFLVWSTDQNPANLDGPTDNKVHLKFEATDGSRSNEADITVPEKTLSSDENHGNPDFSFEGFKLMRGGQSYDTGYYTYRADVTDFFKKIHDDARASGVDFDGLGLLGKYTVSDLECHNDDVYVSGASMIVSGWALILVYRSETVNPKQIYIYNGFAGYSAQQQDLNIKGFEFPDKPRIKIALHVLEGDPGLAAATYNFQKLPPEGLQIHGQTNQNWMIIQNKCNPQMHKDSQGQPFEYSETYNSISSVFSLDAKEPDCVGGMPGSPNPDIMDFAMDVDTFVLDATDDLWAPQFKKHDNNFWLKIGANVDFIFTNFLVLSVDSRAPKFDIPGEREKEECSCAPETDAVCPDYPFYFSIKVQNWGDDISENVTVQDVLPTKNIDYVAGTTEMCKDFDAGKCKKWIKIADGANGAFPLEQPYKVADAMMYCDKATKNCPDTVIVRFQVKPKASIAKNAIIENTALISDSTGVVYKSNSSVPLRLKIGSCPSTTLCQHPDLAKCGGAASDGCKKDSDCKSWQTCDTTSGNCVDDTTKSASNITFSYDAGNNTPSNGESSIIIPKKTNDLLLAQLKIRADAPSQNGKIIRLSKIIFKIAKTDNAIKISNLKLYNDVDNDGKITTKDKEIASSENLKSLMAIMTINEKDSVFEVNKNYNLLLKANIDYPKTVSGIVTFQPMIESKASFEIVASGTTKITDTKVEFAKFRLEQSNVFIFTKGKNDPVIPAKVSGSTAMLQIYAKAPKTPIELSSMKIVALSGINAAKFGDGIKSLSIYLDKTGDGYDVGDQLLTTASFSSVSKYSTIKFPTPIKFNASEAKYFIIKANLNLQKSGTAQIKIAEITKTPSEISVLELPITSKKFTAVSSAGNSDANSGDDSGCSCSTLDVSSSTNNSGNAGILFVSIALLIALRFLLNKKFKS